MPWFDICCKPGDGLFFPSEGVSGHVLTENAFGVWGKHLSAVL